MPSPETLTSTEATSEDLSSSKLSALESARQRYRRLASGSGGTSEGPAQESPTAQQTPGLSCGEHESIPPLSSWKPEPRYVVAMLERMGATRKQAVEAVVVAFWAAGTRVERVKYDHS